MTGLSFSKVAYVFAYLCALSLGACQEASSPVVADAQAVASGGDFTENPATFGTSFHLMSGIYNTPREVNVYVPNIPEWGQGFFETPLPVLYVIDGGLEQDFFHIAALSNLTLINAER